MKLKLMATKVLIVITALMIAIAPRSAYAHDNIGGDELAAANWMLIGAFGVALTGVLGGVWAWRQGQFTNVEESKYTMLETADDYDAIMAEIDARDAVTLAVEQDNLRIKQQPGSIGRAGA